MAIRQIGVGACLALLLTCGCDGETQASDGAGAMSSGSSGPKGEAESAVVAAVAAHWSQGDDGWSTVRVTGSPYAPERVIRQMRHLQVAYVKEQKLTESNRLNGVEWLGEVSFKQSPCREVGPEGPSFEEQHDMDGGRWRDAGRWTSWVQCSVESVWVQRKAGKWMVDDDTFLMGGMPATPNDFAAAGIR